MTLSEAIDAATTLIGHYPHSQNVGDSYIGALAATFGAYPKSIVAQCVAPARGVAAECKFLPTLADVVAWCEKRTDGLRIQVERDVRIERQLADREQFIREQSDRAHKLDYTELKAKFGDWHDGWRPLGERAQIAAQQARDALSAEIGAAAFDALPDGPR
jgi:hypothetical protein